MSEQPSIPQIEFDPNSVEFREPTAWPKVIGIISIAWAGLGLTCALCGAGSMVFMPQILKNNPQMGELPPTLKFGVADFAGLGLGTAMGILLLVAGVTTLRRRFVGRTFHLVYAVIAIVGTLFSTYMQWQKLEVMRQWVQDNPQSPFAKGNPTLSGLVGMAVGLILGLGYPVFLLIWFGAIKKTRESFGDSAPPAI